MINKTKLKKSAFNSIYNRILFSEMIQCVPADRFTVLYFSELLLLEMILCNIE